MKLKSIDIFSDWAHSGKDESYLRFLVEIPTNFSGFFVI